MLSSSKHADLLTLAEAVDIIEYGASCDRCRETRRIDLAKLRERLGGDFLVRDIRPCLRCSKCGTRSVVVVKLWKSSSSTAKLIEHWR